jgi:flagellar FliJ protein
MAKRYTFRFETLLSLRRQREEQEKRVVASRLREIRKLQQRQEALLHRIEEHTDQTRGALRDGLLDLDRLKLGRHWVVRLRRGVLEVEAEISTNKAILAQERMKLTEASKQRKILARLREKRRDRFLFEQNRQEQAAADEVSVLRHARISMRLGGEDS